MALDAIKFCNKLNEIINKTNFLFNKIIKLSAFKSTNGSKFDIPEYLYCWQFWNVIGIDGHFGSQFCPLF